MEAAHWGLLVVGKANGSDIEGELAVVAKVFFRFGDYNVPGGRGAPRYHHHTVDQNVLQHFKFDSIASVGGRGRDRLENPHANRRVFDEGKSRCSTEC